MPPILGTGKEPTVTNDATAPLSTLALLGSLRAGSFNRMLLAAAQELAPPGLALSPWPHIAELPFFDQDAEAKGDPEPVVRFKAALGAAQALLVVSPEYNSGTSGVLKNAIDWGSRGKTPFVGIPVALMTASPGPVGGARAQMQLRMTFHGMGAAVMPAPDVLVGSAGSRFDGGRLSDEATRKVVGDYLARFERFARAIRGS
jgi:chromate reductase